MAEHCSACADLKEYAPQVVRRGITAQVCDSLQNNTGLNPNHPTNPNHDNCEALNDLLNCLIGNLHDRLPSFGICDWKEFTDELMQNLFVLQNAMICSECGQWNALQRQSDRLDRIERILSEILRLLRPSGAWTDTGNVGSNVNVNLSGQPATPIQNIATGNINLFGNQGANNTDGSRFIRTNRIANNQQDIRGGL